MKKRLYGAYGSNLNVEQMLGRCPNAQIVGTAVIEGYELLYKGSRTGAYLTIEQASQGHVPLGIWAVDAQDERWLDRYEGFPNFYYKKDFTLVVTHEDGHKSEEDVFVYIMDERRQLALPHASYIATCVMGYDDFGFDEAVLKKAHLRTQKGMM